MKPEHKPITKEEPKRKGKTSKSKSRMLAMAQEPKLITTPQLREAYSTRLEWVKNLVPKLKEEAEVY